MTRLIGKFQATGLLAVLAFADAAAAQVPAPVGAVLNKYCFECHDDLTAKARLSLESLRPQFTTEQDSRTWARVHDKVTKGEMPPAKKRSPHRTIVFWGSTIGNPSAHASNNLPVFVAGGGFCHQGHIAFDRKNNKPLSNLYLRMLHQLGIDTNSFGSSTGVLSELA